MELVEIYLVMSYFVGRLIFTREKLDNLDSPLYLILPRFSVVIVFSIGLPSVQAMFFLLFLGLILILIDVLWVKEEITSKYYIQLLLVIVVAPSIATNLLGTMEWVENPLYTPFTHIMDFFIPDAIMYPSESFQQILIITTGYIFTVRESNLIIRNVLNSVKVAPRDGEENADTAELNRGRIIGILERTLVYFVIILGQYTGIAIVVALKSIARFREFENRQFAEYFLIGTLLSVLLAVIPALFVNIHLRIMGTGMIFPF